MKLPFTRRPLPAAPPEPEDSPAQVTDVPTAEIAVGSLTGTAPSRVLRHVVVVLDQDDEMHLTTSCCKHELPDLLGRAVFAALRQAMQPGPCYHQDGAS